MKFGIGLLEPWAATVTCCISTRSDRCEMRCESKIHIHLDSPFWQEKGCLASFEGNFFDFQLDHFNERRASQLIIHTKLLEFPC